MRGHAPKQSSMLCLISVEDRVRKDHPLRPIKALADATLQRLSPLFDEIYANSGRRSVPPERLLKAILLQVLYSIRSERQLCEQIEHNMLYRWFLDMDMVEEVFDPTTFTKNRDRLIEHEVTARFFEAVVEQAREAGLTSSDHFSVDGTLIQAWGSLKNFRPKHEEGGDVQTSATPSDAAASRKAAKKADKAARAEAAAAKAAQLKAAKSKAKAARRKAARKADKAAKTERRSIKDNNGWGDFRGQTRSNATHESKTDPDAKLWRKGSGREAKLVYGANALMENRNGLLVDLRVDKMNGKLEVDAALEMLDAKVSGRGTVGADKGYDTKRFVAELRNRGLTPHVARNITTHRGSAIDGRTTRHAGYEVSQIVRRRIEQTFGWMKVFGGLGRSRFRGLERTRLAAYIAGAAYNLLRMSRLMAPA